MNSGNVRARVWRGLDAEPPGVMPAWRGAESIVPAQPRRMRNDILGLFWTIACNPAAPGAGNSYLFQRAAVCATRAPNTLAVSRSPRGGASSAEASAGDWASRPVKPPI